MNKTVHVITKKGTQIIQVDSKLDRLYIHDNVTLNIAHWLAEDTEIPVSAPPNDRIELKIHKVSKLEHNEITTKYYAIEDEFLEKLLTSYEYEIQYQSRVIRDKTEDIFILEDQIESYRAKPFKFLFSIVKHKLRSIFR